MQRSLEHQAVVAHEIAVIAQEHDDGVAGEAEAVEGAQHVAHHRIDARDAAVGQRDRLSRLVRGDGDGAAGARRVATPRRQFGVERRLDRMVARA